LIELDHDPLEFLDGEGLGSLVSPQGGAEAAKADQEMAATLELYETLGGCFNIIGPIDVCYAKVGAGFKVSLRLAALEVASANVGPNQCQTIQGNVLLAKASVQVCLQGKCLTYKAKACYRATPFAGWKCVNKNGTLLCL
jgi:hypothetical protein